MRGKEAAAISDATLEAAHIITTPPIIGVLIFGLLMVALGPYDFHHRFVQIATTLLVLAIIFSLTVHIPNLKKMNLVGHELANMGPPPANEAGPPPQVAEMERRGKAAARNGAILDVAFAIVLVLMVWKPL